MATDEAQSSGFGVGADGAKKLARDAIQKQFDVVKYWLLGFSIFVFPILVIWLVITFEIFILPSLIPRRLKPWRISLLRKMVYYVSEIGIPVIILFVVGVIGYIMDEPDLACGEFGGTLGQAAGAIHACWAVSGLLVGGLFGVILQ